MRKLMWFAIGFAASCAVGIYLLSGVVLVWMMIPFAVLSVGALLFKYKPVRIIGIVLLGFSVGVAWLCGYSSLWLQPANNFDGNLSLVIIEASDYSQETQYGGFVDGNIQLYEKKYKVRLYLDKMRNICPGNQISGVVMLGVTTPTGSEESDYYQGKGIFLVAEPAGGLSVDSTDSIPLRYFPAVLRKNITELLNNTFPDDVLGFVRALLLGDSSLLTYEEDTALKISGIRHIIAVSGLHMSMLFSLVYTLALRRRVSTALLGIPVLLLFAAVAGFTPSINRACIMHLLMILALLLNKEYDPPTALGFAVLVILAANPMTITSVSFQLSVGCVAGIFVFSGRVSGYILKKLGHTKGNSIKAKLARRIGASAGVTLGAMVFTTPLTVLYFGMVSLVSVFANLLTLWAVSIAFGGIMLVCLLGLMWLPLGRMVAWLVSWLARFVLLVARMFASIPLAAVYTYSVYIVIWIVVCYLLFVGFLLTKKKRPLVLLGIMAVCLGISLAASYIEPRLDNVRVTVFDVGEGQSILLQSKGKFYLVDCGGSMDDRVADTVAQTLLSQGIFRLDGIILTHYDEDHTGGIKGLMFRVGVDKLYLPNIADDGIMKDYFAEKYADKICWVEDNNCLIQDANVLTMIPAPNDNANENESSLCVLFQTKNYDILMTGDRGTAGERALLEDYDLPRLDLLVAGHHGSAESTGFELLSKTMPSAVVISSGDKYGHPAQELIHRLNSFGCKIWRTDEDGTIIFRG